MFRRQILKEADRCEETHMGKSEILRALEGLPQTSLREVEEFINVLKKNKGKTQATDRNGKVLAKKQLSAIRSGQGAR